MSMWTKLQALCFSVLMACAFALGASGCGEKKDATAEEAAPIVDQAPAAVAPPAGDQQLDQAGQQTMQYLEERKRSRAREREE